MAVTVNYGKCAACSENNAMTNSTCRKCNADLPWSKKKKAVAAPKPAACAAVKARSAPDIDFGVWFMALLSFALPIIGYFLWRSYTENNNESYARAVGFASVLGILAHIARVVVR